MSLLDVNVPRILIEAELWPVQGERFQPTGFPDLGPAVYRLPDGTEKLLVESPQSMANWLEEEVCWDAARDDVVLELEGLPYVKIDLGPFGITSSILEAHRLNSPFIWEAQGDERRRNFHWQVCQAVGIASNGRLPSWEGGDCDCAACRQRRRRRRRREGARAQEEGPSVPGVVYVRRLAAFCLRYDPNSIVHGVFLEKVDGRFRLPRALSAFIEATRVTPAESGGVKIDRVFPAADRERGISAEQGFTNVPFPRTEFTAERITAYFNYDAALVASYGLPAEGERLVRALALWKVRRFLHSYLRLRTACDLECKKVRLTRPENHVLPSADELNAVVREAIAACQRVGLFADPPVTEFTTFIPEPRPAGAPTGEETEAALEEGSEEAT